jgi:hypothetical protein
MVVTEAAELLVVEVRVPASTASTGPPPPWAPPRLPPRVKVGRKSWPELREELEPERRLPEEEPDSERFLLPPPSVGRGGGRGFLKLPVKTLSTSVSAILV